MTKAWLDFLSRTTRCSIANECAGMRGTRGPLVCDSAVPALLGLFRSTVDIGVIDSEIAANDDSTYHQCSESISEKADIAMAALAYRFISSIAFSVDLNRVKIG